MNLCKVLQFFESLYLLQRKLQNKINYFQMPKIIDNYVLQDKIGSGQFGDVFKGFNQQTQLQVAIKTIKRQTIKGKFYQLLENQIKVLKTCDNPYIMKLYALKKTANHYYLILQYCNGGDMLGKIKKLKKLQQNLVIKYLCQILTGFQTLVKHKIMHRDFKLANILLHDDNIKIADFGFSKLLNTEDYATTMLGSPLNMAPEVLGGNKYNNKADIWSIGACIYQMIYGKPPYMANNMVDLLKNINTKPLSFPNDVKANPVLVDVIKRMLTPDVKKRISWNDLFTHPINRYLDNLLRKEIDLQLVEDQSLMINTSKYYLKKNLVVAKPQDIQEKAKINQQLIQIVKNGEKPKKMQTSQTNKQTQITNSQINTNNQSQTKKVQSKLQSISQSPKKSHLQQQNYSHIYRKNSKIILHYRNIYAFLASVVDQLSQSIQQGAQLAAYVITQKILKMIQWLKKVLNSKQPGLKNIDRWNQYKQQVQYLEVKQYIQKQQNIFIVYAQNLQSTVKEKVLKGQLGNQARQLIMLQKFDDTVYFRQIGNYIKPLVKKVVNQTLCTKDFSFCQKHWKHIENVLICLNFQIQFTSNSFINENIQNSNQSVFDFTQFYQRKQNQSPQQLLNKVEQFLIKIC